jgi:hypothetical protein
MSDSITVDTAACRCCWVNCVCPPSPNCGRHSPSGRRECPETGEMWRPSGFVQTRVSFRRTKRSAFLSRSRFATAETCSEKISSHPPSLDVADCGIQTDLLVTGRYPRVARNGPIAEMRCRAMTGNRASLFQAGSEMVDLDDHPGEPERAVLPCAFA